MHHEIKVGITICTPMPLVKKPDGKLRLQNLTVDWHRARQSLGFPTNIQFFETCADGMEVGVARNHAAAESLRLKSEFLFFIDSDVLMPFDALQKLMRRAREFKDYDIFTGVYCTKNPANAEPLLYMQDGSGPYWDWTLGDLVFDLASCGMGCCLIRTNLFEKVSNTDEDPWFYTPNSIVMKEGGLEKNRGTEDIWFCRKARNEGDAKIMADTSVLCGHQDIDTGVVYGLREDCAPFLRAHWHPSNIEDLDTLKLAIDLGAGGVRRIWEGYRTYTLDLRPGDNTDYVQDLRWLNLPDNHFDLVASSHTLEHIPRWEQERVWGEIFRICKQEGKLEIYVPNVLWAAQKMVDGEEDAHVQNVLYGAQEQHGYERELNTHFFGYTPMLAQALAENAGFVDVEVKTWIDDENLRYNILLTGVKPTMVVKTEASKEEDEDPNSNGDGNGQVRFGDEEVPASSRISDDTFIQ